jgi:hypothetical protein
MRTPNIFLKSAAALLLATALAKLYSATGDAQALTAMDKLLHLRYWQIMVGAGLLETGVAIYLLRSQNTARRALLLLWLSSNFMAYKMASHYLGIKLCPCLGTLAGKLPFSQEHVNAGLAISVVYMLTGSSLILYKQLQSSSRSTGQTKQAALATG